MFNSILWPVDGSPLSFTPAETVIKLARMSSASVVVLSIAEPRLFRSESADALDTGSQVETAHLGAAMRDAARARAAVCDAGLVCFDRVAMAALPSAEIVHTARQQGCDLIVMASRGKSGLLDTLLNGSCTRQVIDTSPVPVLVLT